MSSMKAKQDARSRVQEKVQKVIERVKARRQFYVDLVAALDAMPNKRLLNGALTHGYKRLLRGDLTHGYPDEAGQFEVCALGALCQARGVLADFYEDADYYKTHFEIVPDRDLSERLLAKHLNAPLGLVAHVIATNDNIKKRQSRADRWTRMRAWATAKISELDQDIAESEARLWSSKS